MLHNCRAATKQDSASATHCDLRRRRWYKRSCRNLVNLQFEDYRVKTYPVILVIHVELASSYEDACSTPSGSTQMATKLLSPKHSKGSGINLSRWPSFIYLLRQAWVSFVIPRKDSQTSTLKWDSMTIMLESFDSVAEWLQWWTLPWFSDCFCVPISNETSWNLMKFVLAGLLIKWQWDNNDGSMVLHISVLNQSCKTHPDVQWVGYVFQLLGINQGVTDPSWKRLKKTNRIRFICRYAGMLLVEFVTSASWLFLSGWQKVTCWSLGSSKYQFEKYPGDIFNFLSIPKYVCI